MIEDVHEVASRNVLVCYGCVAMPGLVKIGRSRKEDKDNSSQRRRTSEATSPSRSRGYAYRRTLRCTLICIHNIRELRMTNNNNRAAFQQQPAFGPLEISEDFEYLADVRSGVEESLTVQVTKGNR